MPFIGRGGSSPPSDTFIGTRVRVENGLDQPFARVAAKSQAELHVEVGAVAWIGSLQALCEAAHLIQQAGDV